MTASKTISEAARIVQLERVGAAWDRESLKYTVENCPGACPFEIR